MGCTVTIACQAETWQPRHVHVVLCFFLVCTNPFEGGIRLLPAAQVACARIFLRRVLMSGATSGQKMPGLFPLLW